MDQYFRRGLFQGKGEPQMRGKDKQKTAGCTGKKRQDMKGSAASSVRKDSRNKDTGQELNIPSPWTVSNIDKVTEAVKYPRQPDMPPPFGELMTAP